MSTKPDSLLPVILIVEDDSKEALVIERALTTIRTRHLVVWLPGAEEAINYLGGNPPFSDRIVHPLPVLVLLDLKMPDASGFKALKWLQTRPDLRSIPVVALGGSGLDIERKEAIKLGAAGYYANPQDFTTLLNIVQAIEVRWLSK
jgi:CheY-like chemotaxis protein